MNKDEIAHYTRINGYNIEHYKEAALVQQKELEQALQSASSFNTNSIAGQFNVLFATLCELNSDFRFTPTTNLGDLYDGVIAACPDWFNLQTTEEEFWEVLKAKGVPKKQYFTSLDQINFINAQPNQKGEYSMRELLDWLEEVSKSEATPKPISPPKLRLPKYAAQTTFIEARSVSHALSDAQSHEGWSDVEGEMALLHAPKVKGRKTSLQTRLQPSLELWSWLGIKNHTKDALWDTLKKLNFETNITFQVTLACLLQTEHARREFTLDEIIKLIGRETDARRSQESRQKLRREVWGNILVLASMPVIGARNGTWREPGGKGERRAAIPKEALISRDPLLVITGGKTTDDNGPPKEVSLTAGEWLMPWLGNREMLSSFGDVLKLAHIPRGNTSGAWAVCIGLALQQKWREEAVKAHKKRNSRGDDSKPKVEVLKFRPFTRRELLTELFQCNDDPRTILNDPKGRRKRAEEHWVKAIKELKKQGVIGHYHELALPNTGDTNADWLDQPLSIRPEEKDLKNALLIHDAAREAKARAARSGKKTHKEKPSQE